MSPTAHDTHARPHDQVLVHIAPDQRLRSTSSIPSSTSPSVDPTKSAQDHDTGTKKEHHKDTPYHVDHDSKSHMHQLYHIDSDLNISSNQNSAYQAPSFKDATTIDMTEYPLDRNDDKDGDDTEFNKSENVMAHYGQHHPLKAQQQQLAIDEGEDPWSLKEDNPFFQKQSGQQDDSNSLREEAAHQNRNSLQMQHFHHDALVVPEVPESIASETVGGERGSISLHGQQQSDDIHSQESAALSESTAADQTLENQPGVGSTAGAPYTKIHTTTSASTLIDLPSATVPPSVYQDGSSTLASTTSAAAAAAAVSIVVTGVDNRSQRQQPHSSSLFDFFRGRKTSIPKSGSSLHQPSVTKSTTSSGSAVPAMPLVTQIKAPLTGTPPSINKSRIFPSTTKTAQDSAYPRRGSSSSHNTNTSTHYSHTKPTPQINKRETIGSLPMPIRSDRGMGPHSNRTSYASSHSTSSVFARAGNGGSADSNSSSSPFAADTVPREDSSASAKTGTSASGQVSGVATATATITTTATSTTTNPSPTIPSQSIASSAHSTLTKVAAAVVGATVGKRRPTVTTNETSRETDPGPVNNRLRQGGGGGPRQQPSLLQRPRPPITIVHGIDNQTDLLYEDTPRQRLVGLDQERLGQHATFMKTERSVPELREYISQLYKTILGKDEALEYSQKQISSLQSELDRVRLHAEEEKKELVDEMDRTKEQIVTMEENFLLWRTKVHNDQMTLQDNLLNERLDKQDRIDELEEDLSASQEEADRLRSRLLVLEYEEGYHGPSSFLPDDNNASDLSSCSSSSSHTGSNSSNRGSSVSIAIEHGPMTVDAHRRRSADFTILEQRAQSFEALVQDLRRTLELERQQHQKELKTIRMQSQARFDKLEHDIQAAKMEATMYAEMMHEVVTENDDLRSRVKSANRVMRLHGWSDPNKNSGDSGGKNSSVVVSASTSRSNSQGSASGRRSRPRNSDNFGFPSGIDDDDNESDDGSDDGMEEIAI